ncbi:MAG: polysaccharide deacetylase family protein [Hyphomicrobiaceae bacterium]
MRRSADVLQLGMTLVAATCLLAAPAQAQSCPGNANALGVTRVVEIDTTGGPGFGNEHFNQHDFLRQGEIVLTFDDGPWPGTTAAVLAALDAHCTKGIFFAIGKHATWHPEILKEVAAKGHTIGSHTWSHANLAKLTPDKAKEEIEMGISAVRRAIGDASVPFVRFPNLQHPTEMVKYSGERNLGIWSTDVDSFDFKFTKASDKLVPSILKRLEKRGKGILLMHDFQKSTASAIPELLTQLKAAGYKIVHVKAKGTIQSKPEFDALVVAQLKGPAGVTSDRPTSSVVRTISEEGAPKGAPPPAAVPATKK